MEELINSTVFKDLIESLPDAIIVTDSDGIIKMANRKVADIFGYEPEELLEKEVEVLVPEKFRKEHKQHVKNYFKKPEKKSMAPHRKVMALRKDGSEFEADISLAPVDINGKLYSISSSRDITNKKEYEKVLQEQKEKLESVNKELENYNYTISHDLKAPLARIEGLIDVLMNEISRGKSVEQLGDVPKYIKDSLNSMGSMIKDVLDEARQGKDEAREEVFQVSEVINEVQKMITIPGNFKIEFNCGFSFVPGKKVQLLQVFLNLLSNSIKFNDKEQGVISVSCCEDKDNYRFIFSDNGKGIPEDKLDKIFELFEKNSTDASGTSHGIGLFTVKSIITSRGGTINVRSAVGVGTVFEFTWPKYSPEQDH